MPAPKLPAFNYMMAHIKKGSFIAVFCTLFSLSLNAQVITGYVKAISGQPLPQAHVVIVGEGTITYTHQDGSYRILNPQKGKLTIAASFVGYASSERHLEITENKEYKADFILLPDTVSIPGFIVRATSSSEITGLPVRITTLKNQDIENLPGNSTPDILASVSGVHISSEAGMFSSSSVNIRGIGGTSQTGTLVLMDGIPLNKSDGGSVNWNLIDRDRISRIEIIKGPGSALYGSNAMGGVIHIITGDVTDRKSGDVALSYGTYNTMEAKGKWQGVTGKGGFYYHIFSDYRKSDGYINTPDEVILENDSIVVPVYLDDLFAGGLAGLNLPSGGSMELSVNFFRDIRGRGTRIYESEGSNTTRKTLQGYARYRGSAGRWNIKASLYGSRENFCRLNEYFSDGEYKLYEVHSERDDIGMRLLADRDFGKERILTAGVEVRGGKVDAHDLYFTSTDVISNRGSIEIASAFLQYIHPFHDNRWKTVFGLRYDQAFFHDASYTIEQPSYSIEYFTQFAFQSIKPESWGSLSPKWTLHFAPRPCCKLYVTLARGFRSPVLDDLCRAERIQTGLRAANPSLRPEYTWHQEVGADISFFRRFPLQLSLYHTLGFGFMHPLSTGDSVNLGYTLAPIFMVSNISRVGITGFEADLGIPAGKNLQFFANYTFNRAQILDFEPSTAADADLTGKYLANLPMHKFVLGGNFKTRWVRFSATLKYNGSRWIRDDNATDPIYLLTDRYRPYTTMDAAISKDLGSIRLSVEAEDIFNVIYINSKGYKSPGRMIFIKIQYQYKKGEHI
jgi:iron complex outermembrane recepter protein